MTEELKDNTWIKQGEVAYYTNVLLMGVKCYIAEEDPDDREYVFIYKGEKVGRMPKSKLFKTHEEADLR